MEGEFLRNDRTERFELLPLPGVVLQEGSQPGDGRIHLVGGVIGIEEVLLPRDHVSAGRALGFEHPDEQLVEPAFDLLAAKDGVLVSDQAAVAQIGKDPDQE